MENCKPILILPYRVKGWADLADCLCTKWLTCLQTVTDTGTHNQAQQMVTLLLGHSALPLCHATNNLTAKTFSTLWTYCTAQNDNNSTKCKRRTKTPNYVSRPLYAYGTLWVSQL